MYSLNFNIKRLSLLILWGFIVFGLNAQHTEISNENDTAHRCEVIHIQIRDRANKPMRVSPSELTAFDREDFIYKNDKVYVFRLALAITKDFYASEFNNDPKEVEKFWNKAERDLNNLYMRDVGIRFEVIRDKRLYTEIPPYSEMLNGFHEGAKYLNPILGEKNYELGVFIMRNTGGLQGQAALGGVLSDYSKASVRSTTRFSTLGHEIGHMFGAPHTFYNSNVGDGVVTEPGLGQSIMSYGDPRTFFSLASIRQIRYTLSRLSYYTDAQRKVLHQGTADSNNTPYIESSTSVRPQLDKESIKHEYVVTEGTYFQFYIPVKNKQEEFLYHAHTYDPMIQTLETNTLQRLYEPSKDNCIMYYPRWQLPIPSYDYSSYREDFLSYSNVFTPGLYTYALSAFNKGQHDAVLTKLRIIPGERFQITKVEGISHTLDKALAGKQLSVSWNGCQSIYGKDSKVRIWLSTDFGKTFKYLLADNVPNNGHWTGTWPHIEIGTVWDDMLGTLRGGTLKVEVVGEAAFDLSHIKPYIIQGRNKINTGGFLLSTADAITFIDAPESYIQVATWEDVPDVATVTGSYKGETKTAEVKTETVENRIHHTWTVAIGGKTAQFTQTIEVIENEYKAKQVLMEKARLLAVTATDLYKHIGDLAYPKAELEASKNFKNLYINVFTADGDFQKNFTTDDVDALREAINKLNLISDDDIVKPLNGRKYKILNYQQSFGKEYRWYLYPSTSDANGEQASLSSDNAALWQSNIIGDSYQFTSDNKYLYLHNVGKGKRSLHLDRGYTWGSFSIVTADNTPRIAQLNRLGTIFSYNELYYTNKKGYRFNQSGGSVSTDFQMELVPESFKVYYQTKDWNNGVYAYLKGENNEEPFGKFPGTQMTAVGNHRYEVTIPEGFGEANIIFSNSQNSENKTQTIKLQNITATYGTLDGKRVYSLNIDKLNYSTLYLDFAVKIPDGVQAYTATAEPKTKLQYENKDYEFKLNRIEQFIPAYTAVILKANDTNIYDFVETEQKVAFIKENQLLGSTSDILLNILDEDYHYFDLSKPTGNLTNGKITYNTIKEGTIPANRAYYRLYKYDNNYNVNLITLQTDEFTKLTGDGTFENPYTASDVAQLPSSNKSVWIKGKILENVTLTSKPANIKNVIAVGTDNNTFVPVYLPEGYRAGAANMVGREVWIKGTLSTYLDRKGIAANDFKQLDYREELSIDELGYTTYYSPYAFELPEGVEAWTVTNNNGTLTLNKSAYATNKVIPKETGVILKGATNKYSLKAMPEPNSKTTDNVLQGSLNDVSLNNSEMNYYLLSKGNQGVGLYLRKMMTNKARQAYAVLPTSVNAPNVLLFDTPTGLQNFDVSNLDPATLVYNITGHIVGTVADWSRLPKGRIYIVAKRKVLKQ